MRRGDWKAVRLHALEPERSVVELYKLAEDLGEERDLAAEHPEIVAELTALMNQAHVDQPGYVIAPYAP